MNIIIMDMANLTPLVIPTTPTNYSVKIGGDNSEEDTINGKINILKNAKLRYVSWSSFFSIHKHTNERSVSFPTGWVYVSFLETMKTLKLPIRIIVTSSKSLPTMTMLASIEDFTYSIDTAGDIQYSLQLKETPERIYEFFLRDIEYLKKAGKYIGRFFTESEKFEKLKNAGLFIAQQKYK